MSHLRFGPSPITSQYLVRAADYVAVHHSSYLHKYDWHSSMKPGARLVLNCEYPAEEVADHIPNDAKKHLAELGAEIYVINALDISRAAGLGKRINMASPPPPNARLLIVEAAQQGLSRSHCVFVLDSCDANSVQIMQAVFFFLSGVMPFEKAIALLKKAIEKAYSKKGPEVVQMNYKAVDQALAGLKTLKYDGESWRNGSAVYIHPHGKIGADSEVPQYVREVVQPVLALKVRTASPEYVACFVGRLKEARFPRETSCRCLPLPTLEALLAELCPQGRPSTKSARSGIAGLAERVDCGCPGLPLLVAMLDPKFLGPLGLCRLRLWYQSGSTPTSAPSVTNAPSFARTPQSAPNLPQPRSASAPRMATTRSR